MQNHQEWQQASSNNPDPVQAVAEIHSKLRGSNASLILCYCSHEYDRQALERAFNQYFHHQELVACTTAGELSEHGYDEKSIIALSLHPDDFQAAVLCLDDLHDFNMAKTLAACENLKERLDCHHAGLAKEQSFGMLLIDGLSKKEELVSSTLYEALDGLPLFGGSVADGLNFQTTEIFYNGHFRSDRAVLTLIRTRHPFKVFKTEHFHPTDKQIVVTESDARERVVYELNGAPAAQEYARLLGISVTDLSPNIYAIAPLLVKVAGQYHVRSILGHNPEDDSLRFYCAVDKGIVMRIGECGDIVGNLQEALTGLKSEFGDIELILGCDCILRRLEIQRKNLVEPLNQLLKQYHIFGFNTYGEQLNALHINQTFSGVAIGKAKPK